ncbi:enoyl-CoA hydratase-related protein [Salarchaeum sp. III]|uniref:enoyl-CoA hydratase/isomerase family protein n=1 Tax=Salarchaeum sp. III TaxID=3107927 RepID=UPI002ED81466
MSEAVTLDVTDGVATIRLDQPERRNALSREITAGLRDHLEHVRDEVDDARAVVVQGSGGAFSAGGDIAAMKERLNSDESLEEAVKTLERTTSETLALLVEFPLPTIAKVDGPAVGAGANLAIACDVQLATEDASIGFVFRQVGLSVDAGTSYLLPRVVGTNVAKELVYTGEIMGAERAHDLGLFNHVYGSDEFEAKADAMVERIASGPTAAFRHAKRLIDEGFEKTIDQAMTDEAVAQGVVFDTYDHEEGVRAFLEDREPEFEGR